MPGGVGACCKLRQLVGDQRRRPLDQFLVVWPRQQVLAVFVRLPWRVQDAGYETGGLCREVRPETAWIGQPIDRCGPPDRYFVTVVERSSIGSGVSRQAMDDLEALPGNGLAAFDKPIVFAGALQFQHSLQRRSVFDAQLSHMLDEQEELGREVPQLPAQVVRCARLQAQPHDIGCPVHEIPESCVLIASLMRVDRIGDAQHRATLGVRCDLPYAFARPLAIEAERAGAAEKLGGVRHAQDRLEAEAEPPDLAGQAAALASAAGSGGSLCVKNTANSTSTSAAQAAGISQIDSHWCAGASPATT